jgi:hypothetical protein
MSRRRSYSLGAALAGLAVLLVVPGCRRSSAGLELISYKDPYSPATYSLALSECAYYADASGDYYILARAADSDAGSDAADHLLCVHLFWKPRPGKTFDNETSIDATIRYAIITGAGAAVYSGSGYAYPKKPDALGRLVAKLEVARLRLVSQSGDVPELLGATRISGTLIAKDDAGLAIDLRRQFDIRSGL